MKTCPVYGHHDKMAYTKNTHRTAQKHTEHQDATGIQKKIFLVFFEKKTQSNVNQ